MLIAILMDVYTEVKGGAQASETLCQQARVTLRRYRMNLWVSGARSSEAIVLVFRNVCRTGVSLFLPVRSHRWGGCSAW